jgi:hypothetical protein
LISVGLIVAGAVLYVMAPKLKASKNFAAKQKAAAS